MNKDVKIFVVIVIMLLLISIIGTYEASKVIVKPGNINPPYAKVTNAWIVNGKVIIQVKVVNNGYNLSLTGGYVEILNTGQKENVTPSNYLFNVSFPLSYVLASISQITVDGVLKGNIDGSTVYITFSSPASIMIVNSIKLLNFSYSNYTLYLYLKVFSPLNISLHEIQDISLVNYNLSRFVATVSLIPLNYSLSPGVHYLNLTFNLRNYTSNIYFSSLSKGYTYYLEGYVLSTIYYSPPQNYTFIIRCIETFS
ncbi:hypothetical protein B6F84_12460 [Acidianus manzaensis]|uniref:CARDB domain-containing protein n=2 Tax=Acidianus manzaensis TaxID=282676 RepID=A0A1W6K2M4_9CREN|nr:hypothetical protein B6F84_12460 [Acidianus manzaensis]